MCNLNFLLLQALKLQFMLTHHCTLDLTDMENVSNSKKQVLSRKWSHLIIPYQGVTIQGINKKSLE